MKKNSKSSFGAKVIAVVSGIRRGRVMTYAEVAKKAGNPKAARAVGNILNRHYRQRLCAPMPAIPCHRVVRSDGNIGGYAGGSPLKKRMLKDEKAI